MSTNYSLQRKLRPKKWSQVYAEKVVENHANHCAAQDAASNGIMRTWALAVMCKRVANRIKARRKSIKDFKNIPDENSATLPTNLSFNTWQPHWGSQNICYICNRPGFNDCVMCKSCDIIAHSYCASKSQTIQVVRKKSYDVYSQDIRKIPDNEFTCSYCVELHDEEKTRFVKELYDLKEGRNRFTYGKLIAKRLVAYALRIRFMRQKRYAIKIQAFVRCFICRRKFQSWRKAQMRVLVVAIRDLPILPEGTAVILTAIDTMKHVQLFRFDKTIERNAEEGNQYI